MWRRPRALVLLSLLCIIPTWALSPDDDMMGDDDFMGMDGEGDPYDDEDFAGDGDGDAGFGESMGALSLDNYTFDKVVRLPGRTLLAKFDKDYPYGEKQKEFVILCQTAYAVPDLFVGEVHVQEYGDYENDDLRRRYNLKSEDFPAFLLFKGDPTDWTRYQGDVTASEIARWLRQRGVKMPFIGTIPALDDIALKFMKGGLSEEDMTTAQRLVDTDFKSDRKAPMYVKIMQKLKEKGDQYAKMEIARVQKIMQGQLSESKRSELADKVKVLTVFAAKDEL